MFTTPDHDDAATTLPPISTPGPKPQGYYLDCDSASGQEGTTFRAEEFNELALNLRALLTQAGVPPVKGNPTMLWQAVLQLPVILVPRTLYVTPTGSANPVNPFGGDPFNSLTAVFNFLGRYQIAPTGSVAINVAAGTYTATQPVAIDHANGTHITVTGAGSANTILQFNGCHGFATSTQLGNITRLQIRGNGSVFSGITLDRGAATIDQDVTIDNFGDPGIVIRDGNLQVLNSVTVKNSGARGGILIQDGGVLKAENATIQLTANAGPAQLAIDQGLARIKTLNTSGGVCGIALTSASARAIVESIHISDLVGGTNGFIVVNGGFLLSTGAGVWEAKASAGTPFYGVYASTFAVIQSSTVLVAGNRALANPPINTFGNIQAYIVAT